MNTKTVSHDLRGKPFTAADLPEPEGFIRWVQKTKHKVAMAVIDGLIGFEEAMTKYRISAAELGGWMDAARNNPAALKIDNTIRDDAPMNHLPSLNTRRSIVVEGMTLEFDYIGDGATINGVRVDLRGLEHPFLRMLVTNQGILVEKAKFFGKSSKAEKLKIVDVVICNLRRKMNDACDGAGGQTFIETVWGRGYRLRASTVSTV